MGIFWLILIGMTAGLLAGYFMTGNRFGTIGDIIAGVMGALIGGALFEKTGIFAGSSLIGSLDGCDHRRDCLFIWRAHGQKGVGEADRWATSFERKMRP